MLQQTMLFMLSIVQAVANQVIESKWHSQLVQEFQKQINMEFCFNHLIWEENLTMKYMYRQYIKNVFPCLDLEDLVAASVDTHYPILVEHMVLEGH